MTKPHRVACGGGLLSEPLARIGVQVVGIDASPGNIAAARQHAASVGRAGLQQTELRGMRCVPLLHRASWCRDTRVNYMAAFAHGARVPVQP